jgi:uncharacterized protein (UPF0548 family)
MFSFRRPTEAAIRHDLERARRLPPSCGFTLNTQSGNEPGVSALLIPTGYKRDHTRTEIGRGLRAFEAAKLALRQWQQFDLGWVRIANPSAAIERDQVVAVEARTFALWSVNFSRILYVIDEDDRFGFGYGTTAMHVERGEERFLLEFYPVSGAVEYDLLAVSEPAHWLARLAYPFTRSRQKKFALDSHRLMRQIAGGSG